MDVATPGELLPAIASVAKTVGLIMNTMIGGPTGNGKESNSSSSEEAAGSDDPCQAVSLIDKINADKPGVVEYETDIGDSGRSLSSV